MVSAIPSTNAPLGVDELQALEAQCTIHTYNRLPVAFTRGRGTRLWDAGGNEYLDFLGGIAVTVLGHCHPAVTAAITAQAEQLLHTSNLYYIEPQARLAEQLHRLSGGMKAFFCNSGTEANEAALKLARRLARQRHGTQTGRHEVIATLGSFHGRTYGSLAATGQPRLHEGFAPMPGGFVHVPWNDVAALRAAVTPRTAAIILELIQGEIGVRPVTEAYVEAVRELCAQHNLVLVVDEIQTGMGRTGRFLACQWYGLQPDLVTLAKGLGNGLPIGCLLATPAAAEALPPGSHGSTFGGNFLSTAAALATLDVLESEQLIANAAGTGTYLMQQLQAWGERTGAVREVRGRGLMIGVALHQPVAKKLLLAALRQGLVINAPDESTLRLLPALTLTPAEADEGVARLGAAWIELEGELSG